jgi:Glycosyl transferase family 2
MPRVTIITPTYRHARFIRACVHSVLAQTFLDWEMVVVDDGSDDGTPDLVESYGDSRITLVRRENQGLAGLGSAYATALALGTGQILAILEGDDAWPPNKLETQVPFFDDKRVVLSYGPAQLMDDRGCLYSRYWRAPTGRAAHNDPLGSVLPALVARNFIVSSTVMVHRRALERVGGFQQPPEVPFVDHPTWLMLAGVGLFAPASQVVGFWRRHAAQYTTRGLDSPSPYRRGYLADAVGTAMPETARQALSDLVTTDEQRQEEIARVGRARLALLSGNWPRAGSLWAELVRVGSPAVRVIAIVGLVSAAFKTDVEWLYRRTGRFSWPSRRHTASHAGTARTADPGDQS